MSGALDREELASVLKNMYKKGRHPAVRFGPAGVPDMSRAGTAHWAWHGLVLVLTKCIIRIPIGRKSVPE